MPVRSFFSDVVLRYKTIFSHFRKWCKNGEWEYCWTKILEKHKSFLDLSSADLDGSHATAKKWLIGVERTGKRQILCIFMTDSGFTFSLIKSNDR